MDSKSIEFFRTDLRVKQLAAKKAKKTLRPKIRCIESTCKKFFMPKNVGKLFCPECDKRRKATSA